MEIENLDDPAAHTERVKAWKDETTSVIHSRFAGSLLEEELARFTYTRLAGDE